MARKQAVDQLAAKQRKQKLIAIVGAVVLIALVAIQGPKLLKRPQGGPDGPAQAAAEFRQPGPADPAAGQASTDAGAQAPTPSGSSVVGQAPAAAESQLVSFERFSAKDPFLPQVRASVPSTSSGAQPAQGSRPGRLNAKPAKSQKPAAPRPGRQRPTSAGERPTSRVEHPPTEAPTSKSAIISVNGARDTVEVGAAFPDAQKLFKLVSLTAKEAKVGIAGGSLVGDSETVTLERGKPLTLMNTADGARYQLLLVAVS